MNLEELLRRIKFEAEKDRKNRQDVRFLNTMGLLVAKGFLRTNQQITPKPNQRIRIEDAIWAGQYVEPRILEVLPAAVLRLPRHFDFDPNRHAELAPILRELKRGADQGPPFQGIPFEKLKIWVDLPLRDKRIKSLAQKRVLKTFRLNPESLESLRLSASERMCSETQIIESFLIRRPSAEFELSPPGLDIDQNLREKPQDPEHAWRYVFYLRGRAAEAPDAGRQARFMGEIGVWLRVLEKLEESESILTRSLNLIRQQNLGVAMEIQQRIRRAHVWQWRREFDRSTSEFAEIIQICGRDSLARQYLDFAWQHAGKNFFDQGRYAEALMAFETALRLRKQRNAPADQVESTLIAIRRVKELLDRSSGPANTRQIRPRRRSR